MADITENIVDITENIVVMQELKGLDIINLDKQKQLHHSLDYLLEKYKDNDYISGRIVNYMEHILPVALENDEQSRKDREERKKNLELERDDFTSRFLHLNKYFYTPQTELFLLYDGLHFNLYSEDNIQHQILTNITNEKNLMIWKRKIRNNIMKRIKEQSPLKAIPESSTIQYVINCIYPSIFPTRNTAKYFLTIIGDCINHHASTTTSIIPSNQQGLIYIASPTIKQFIMEISNQCYTYFGISNSLSNIKYKYYEHTYEKCRLINFSNTSHTKTVIQLDTGLVKNMIDLLCVSSHYSARYGSADGFLKQCSETKLVEHALYLNKNSLISIVEYFIDKTIKPCPGSKLYNKNMLFLFKKYLEEKNIPNIAFHESLKTIFKEKLNYKEEDDSFNDITSIQLPIVSNFMKFWDSSISEDSYDEEYEFEIDEIITLFKLWLSKNKTTGISSSNMSISDTLLIELIRHFYPDIIIEDNKYVMHIKCNLWNKRVEIVNSLALFKLKCNSENEPFTKSLYQAYEYYSLMNKHPCLASKRYFEKTATDIIEDNHIDGDGIISPTWWS
jgi:hypothetical protein